MSFQKVLSIIVVSLRLVTPGNAERHLRLEEVQEDSYPFITEILAPAAVEMAVSEAARLVAVTHKGKNAGQISIFSLDKTGGLTGTEPIFLVLPKRGELAKHANYALGVTFHPSLPLLYVWQDVTLPGDADAGTFEHLLIFRIANGKAELVQACGKGSDYSVGHKVGYIAVDRKATRLFFPNLQRKSNDKQLYGIGYFKLGWDGLVLAAAGTAADDFVAQRETEYPVFTAPDKTGGFVPVADDVIIFAGAAGPVSWDLVEARQRFAMYNIYPVARKNRRIAAHPTLPVVYMSFTLCEEPNCVHPIYVIRLKHAEGFLTSNFQFTSVYGPLAPPVVLGRRQMVAYGGKGQVHFISIDKEGDFLPEVRRAKVGKTEITALSYSEEFDKLYVAVEKDE